jgi:hypothetical protein
VPLSHTHDTMDEPREAETDVTSVVTELRTKSWHWHRSMPLQRCNAKTITIWDFTGRRDSSGNQRDSATLFP